MTADAREATVPSGIRVLAGGETCRVKVQYAVEYFQVFGAQEQHRAKENIANNVIRNIRNAPNKISSAL